MLLQQASDLESDRKVWEIYTANALGAIVNGLGGKIELYSDLINQRPEDTKTAEEIINDLLERL